MSRAWVALGFFTLSLASHGLSVALVLVEIHEGVDNRGLRQEVADAHATCLILTTAFFLFGLGSAIAAMINLRSRRLSRSSQQPSALTRDIR